MKKHQKSLIRLIKEIIGSPNSGAEIGVFKGATSVTLMEAFPSCSMFFVDPWKRWTEGSYMHDGNMNKFSQEEWHNIMEEAVSNIHSVEAGHFQIIHGTSSYASKMIQDKSLDFVFIDANHFYDGIKSDLELWLPKTKKLICGHDYKNKRDIKGSFGISKAVHELFGEENILSRAGTIWGYVIDGDVSE